MVAPLEKNSLPCSSASSPPPHTHTLHPLLLGKRHGHSQAKHNVTVTLETKLREGLREKQNTILQC